jgi:ribosomal protein S18 acetylase RimI-like enzyme
VVRAFSPLDVDAVVAYWNQAFAQQPNFRAITAGEFGERVLDCALFDPKGLLLAWAGGERLVGMAHALRPAPTDADRFEDGHFLAILHVDPAHRHQGIGSRLLRAAENFLYYCPVYVGAASVPCYGRETGHFAPLFGPSGVPALGMQDLDMINFLAHRGYRSAGLGDVTLALTVTEPTRSQPTGDAGQTAQGLRWAAGDQIVPSPPKRGEDGLALLDGHDEVVGHVDWAALGAQRWAITRWWVDAAWRGRGLGQALLDRALGQMAATRPEAQVEIRLHLAQQQRAADLLKRRGFVVDAAWVSLVKT